METHTFSFKYILVEILFKDLPVWRIFFFFFQSHLARLNNRNTSQYEAIQFNSTTNYVL